MLKYLLNKLAIIIFLQKVIYFLGFEIKKRELREKHIIVSAYDECKFIQSHLSSSIRSVIELEPSPHSIICKTLLSYGIFATQFSPLTIKLQSFDNKVNLKFLYGIRAAFRKELIETIPSFDALILTSGSETLFKHYTLNEVLSIINYFNIRKQIILRIPESSLDLQIINEHFKHDLGMGVEVSVVKNREYLYVSINKKPAGAYGVVSKHGLSAIGYRSDILEVDLNKCCDPFNFTFSDKGWHYFTETMHQYRANPNMNWRDSKLYVFYQKHQPKSFQEAMFEDIEEPIDKLSQLPARASFRNPFPWVSDLMCKHPDRAYQQDFGPNSHEFIKREFKRIVRNYEMMAKEGYKPEIFPDGFIRGVLLKRDEDYRFLISGGTHRAAALSALGIRSVMVKFDSRWDRVIDIERILDWPQVRNGFYSVDCAKLIFDRYFEKTGIEKAQRLDLL